MNLSMPTSKSLIPTERIEKSILLIRGHKVILDSDLAELYGVTTARLNEQVRRNKERFPKDFKQQFTTVWSFPDRGLESKYEGPC